MAKENARNNGSIVVFEQQDALSPPDDHDRWDIIVSNPPYICDKESDGMERNVLDYEPHLALFVPDNDPLCFYRAIGQYAHKALKTGGRLFFELNAAYADETKTLMEQLGFTNTEIKDDQFGRHRFLKTSRP
jgi:release factor glutamine methyltransferase